MLVYVLISLFFIIVILIFIYSFYKSIIYNNSIKLYGSSTNKDIMNKQNYINTIDYMTNDNRYITDIDDIGFVYKEYIKAMDLCNMSNNESIKEHYNIVINISNYITNIITKNIVVDYNILYKLINHFMWNIQCISNDVYNYFVNNIIIYLTNIIHKQQKHNDILNDSALYMMLLMIYGKILEEYYYDNYIDLLEFLNILLSHDIYDCIDEKDVSIYYCVMIQLLPNILNTLIYYNDIKEKYLINNIIETCFNNICEYEIIINKYVNDINCKSKLYNCISISLSTIFNELYYDNNVDTTNIMFNIIKNIGYTTIDKEHIICIIFNNCVNEIIRINELLNKKYNETMAYTNDNDILFKPNYIVHKHINISNENIICLCTFLSNLINIIEHSKYHITLKLIDSVIEGINKAWLYITNDQCIKLINTLLHIMIVNKDIIIDINNDLYKNKKLITNTTIHCYNNIIHNYCYIIEKYNNANNKDTHITNEYIKSILDKYII